MDLEELRRKKRARDLSNSLRGSAKSTMPNLGATSSRPSDEAERHYHLAKCYDEGLEGFEKNEGKAMLEWLAAAELGHSGAMTEVSCDYSDPEDSILGYDLQKAEIWARKAIQYGNPDGYKCLFDVLEEQHRGADAMTQLETGVTKGSLDCVEWLSFLLYYGSQVAEYSIPEDEDRAFNLLNSFTWDNEHSIAFEILANIYRNREDYVNAVRFYEKALAVDSENYSAMASLGQLLNNRENVRDYSRAESLLRKAAEHGNFRAMNNLGVMLYLGDGVEQDVSKGIDWIKKAAENGHPGAMMNLYHILCDTNPDEAMYWLKRAANEGDNDAQEKLRQLENEGKMVDMSRSNKIYDYQLSNKENTLKLSTYSFPGRLSGIQKVIDDEGISDYEADRLRLLQGWLSLVYFKEHFCDDDFDKYEDAYYEILDKVDDYIGSMSNISDEARYLYYTSNMYSASRFKDVNPQNKLEELWNNIQEIKLDEKETEFKVSFWEETAKDVHDLMWELLKIKSSNNTSHRGSGNQGDHIKRKVFEIIQEKLFVEWDEIHSYSELIKDLGADSLDAVEIIMEMEKAFNLSIPDADAERIKTVGDIINYIEAHI